MTEQLQKKVEQAIKLIQLAGADGEVVEVAYSGEKGRVAFIVPHVKLLHTMNNTKQTAGETAKQGFYWLTEWTDNCDTLTASQLGYLLRLLDDFIRGKVDKQEHQFVDPEVEIAYKFITRKLEKEAEQ